MVSTGWRPRAVRQDRPAPATVNTAERDEEALRLRGEGLSLDEIADRLAEQYGRRWTGGSVSRMLRQAGQRRAARRKLHAAVQSMALAAERDAAQAAERAAERDNNIAAGREPVDTGRPCPHCRRPIRVSRLATLGRRDEDLPAVAGAAAICARCVALALCRMTVLLHGSVGGGQSSQGHPGHQGRLNEHRRRVAAAGGHTVERAVGRTGGIIVIRRGAA